MQNFSRNGAFESPHCVNVDLVDARNKECCSLMFFYCFATILMQILHLIQQCFYF